ncbi:MAG: N-acetylmuramoyl-L-alanine amidase [Spirochaetales bacterium]|nr:N-acetylmuramoyl-L-alanine amidase [Spirochaetales bacterium]
MQEGSEELIAILEEAGAALSWDPVARRGEILHRGTRISFRLGFPAVVQNSRQKVPITIFRGPDQSLRVDKHGAQQLRSLMRRTPTEGEFPRITTILIDPGHGGKDPGTIGMHSVNGEILSLMEKNIVLQVSLQFVDMLRQRYPNKRIIMTRSEDSYPTLEERVELANKQKLGPSEAMIFISIHVNASLNKDATGFEVWYLPPEYRRNVMNPDAVGETDEHVIPILNAMLEEEYTRESVLLAQKVLDSLEKNVGEESPNRGLKAESWFVVRKAKMPSVLVELGFVTNKEEAMRFTRKDYLMKLSQALYTGTVEFIKQFEQGY